MNDLLRLFLTLAVFISSLFGLNYLRIKEVPHIYTIILAGISMLTLLLLSFVGSKGGSDEK